jgi:hypothetical protein
MRGANSLSGKELRSLIAEKSFTEKIFPNPLKIVSFFFLGVILGSV